jgi:photosystem II stability/assembly factor-like uncharacterized protein
MSGRPSPIRRLSSAIPHRALFGVAVATLVASPAGAQWTPMTSGTTASLRGLSVASGRVAWASGTRGTVVYTSDGGASWRVDTVPGAGAFDLRSVHARNARVAHVAATAGRIWRTTDGGAHWSLRYQAADTSVFLDAIDFWDDQHGIAMGDPMGGRFFILLTDDGGTTWREAPADARPEAMAREAAFAASGTSLVIDGSGACWLGTGGGAARVAVSRNRGRSWTWYPTPILQGSASQGIFSVAVVPGRAIIAVGGDYSHPDSTRAIAFTGTGRAPVQWTVPSTGPRAYRSGVAIDATAGAGAGATTIAVGPDGSDVSHDLGATWAAFDSVGYHAVRSRDGVFYASGSGGRIGRYDAHHR